MGKRLTQKEIEFFQGEAMLALWRESVYAEKRVKTVTEMTDNLRWAFNSPDMPPSSWALMGRRREFWRWLREYRTHVETLSPKSRAKLRKLKTWL